METNKIKVPWTGLDRWKQQNVKCWNDPALQAYLKRKEILNTLATCLFILAAAGAGAIYEYTMIIQAMAR
jgi:hypothetical protein